MHAAAGFAAKAATLLFCLRRIDFSWHFFGDYPLVGCCQRAILFGRNM
jgi:hypothetical protein